MYKPPISDRRDPETKISKNCQLGGPTNFGPSGPKKQKNQLFHTSLFELTKAVSSLGTPRPRDSLSACFVRHTDRQTDRQADIFERTERQLHKEILLVIHPSIHTYIHQTDKHIHGS